MQFHPNSFHCYFFRYSGQIDWAPTMLTKDPTVPSRTTFGFGIWKSVYLLPLPIDGSNGANGGTAITQLVPHTFYAGGHPTSILSDTTHKGFEVRARVGLYSVAGGAGTVSVVGAWPGAIARSRTVMLAEGYNNVTVVLEAAQTLRARLWQPNGHGEQPRYSITVTFTPSAVLPAGTGKVRRRSEATVTATTSRLIGFRHVALITVNDTDPTSAVTAATQEGSGQLTMFFRVNGAPLYARGGNKIPMELLDGRMSAVGHRRLVQSAAEGHFNMLRIWGGAIWEPQAFYDACDEFGVLLYHDMQFTWSSIADSMPPTSALGEIVTRELWYQIERNSHHPSIAVWDGCNECQGGGLYASYVMPTVGAIDQSRPIWPSCPSDGWFSGVDRLTSRPNGNPLITLDEKHLQGIGRPTGYPFKLESHGPYTAFLRFGTGQMNDTVMSLAEQPPPQSGNGCNEDQANPSCARYAVPALTGAGNEGWYRSEFGAAAWSSFESMSGNMPPSQWSMQSPAAANRNWNVSNVIGTFFGMTAVQVGMKQTGEVNQDSRISINCTSSRIEGV